MQIKQKLIVIAMPILAIVVALIIAAFLILGVGENPLNAYGLLLKSSFGSFRAFTDTLVKTVPLVFTGLSFAVAAKCNVWNIGAEGQLYMGAVASVAVGIYVKGLPMAIHLPLAIIAGMAAGAIWAFIAAWGKVRFKVNEVVSTIMLNYVAILIASALVYGPMIEDPYKSPQTTDVLETARLPVLFQGTKLHAGIIIAILACVVFYVIFKHTKLGFDITAVGYNKEAARFAGIPVKKNLYLSMILAGIFGGLAGTVEMLGTNGLLIIGFSPGYGSDGIAVALLGQLNALGMFLSSFLFGALRLGATTLQRTTDIPQQIIVIIQGIIVLLVIAGTSLTKVVQNHFAKKEVK